MHFRRIACLLLGAWIAGSLFMMWVATQNFRAADELLTEGKGPAAKQIQVLGKDQARAFLRFHALAQNRIYFQNWERVQLVIGVLLLLSLFFGTNARPTVLLMTLLMVVAVALMHWLMTPEIDKLGRAVAFVADSKSSADRARFWGFHSAYATIDVIKTAMAFLIAMHLLLRRRRRRVEVLEDFDGVDDADNSHVDR